LHTAFWYFITFREWQWKFLCCIVSMWCMLELTINWFQFFIINRRRESMYQDSSGNISKLKLLLYQRSWPKLQSIIHLLCWTVIATIILQTEYLLWTLYWVFFHNPVKENQLMLKGVVTSGGYSFLLSYFSF
jgi:hypothetical protein